MSPAKEILAPSCPPVLPQPAPPTSVFDRQASRQPSVFDAKRVVSVSIQPACHDTLVSAVDSDKHASGSTSTNDRALSNRPSFCGFLPLSPICASPVPTPTNAMSFRVLDTHSDPDQDGDASSESTTSADYSTAPTSPVHEVPIRPHLLPPTWISIPPTPPPKLVRRSVTCTTQRLSPLSPSASFPTSMSPHVPSDPGHSLRRRASVPSMSSCPQESSATLRSPGNGHAIQDVKFTTSPLPASFYAFTGDDTEINGFPATHPEPLLRVTHEVSSDNGHYKIGLSNDETSADGSSSGHCLDDPWSREKKKDNVRKYHALMELLTTEIGYLLHLRTLVTIYLRNLPTLTYRTSGSAGSFGRLSSSFASSSRVNLVAYFHPYASSSSTTLADGHPKDKEKGLSRYLFTDAEIELLTRNAEELLRLHEQFVEELRSVVVPFGFPMSSHEAASSFEMPQNAGFENVDAAIDAVSMKFATEADEQASRFNLYQVFCAGHPEALALVLRVQQQYPIEWDAFEQQCSGLASDIEADLRLPMAHDSKVETQPSPQRTPQRGRDPLLVQPFASKERRRTPSLSSIDAAVRSWRYRASGGHKDPSPSEIRKDRGSPRLAFTDYMIRPVQRICQYPLLLEQLKPSKTVGTLSASGSFVLPNVNDVVVESAMLAMKHEASLVDEARHRQDVAIRSSLIVSRIILASPASGPSYLSTVQPAFQVLTPTFLSSLGTCLLAGSLDVMHHHSFKSFGNSPYIDANYLGAFLYMGGYLILVKVYKGKVYEPRHWFSLAGFDIIDVTEDEAMLPCSFHLLCNGHQFELAAACELEKSAWMIAIEESLKHPPRWTDEPPSSLQLDGKGEIIPSAPDDVPFVAIDTLPATQPISEFAGKAGHSGLSESLLAALRTDMTPSKSAKQDMSYRAEVPIPPSRRSSSASVKAIFSPISADSDTVVIRRSSVIVRSQVDRGLRDIISEPCLTARSLASKREEELFRAPKIMHPKFGRSNSGLSMNRLRRHESVRVPRRKSLQDRSDSIPIKSSMSRRTSLASRRHTKKLSITSTSENEGNMFVPDSDPSSYSPSPFSYSSTMTSSPGSSLPSPTRESNFPPYSGGPMPETEVYQKNTRSLANNVRGLFLSRQTSPVSLHSSSHSQGPIPDVQRQRRQTVTPGFLKRWATTPLHRRARSTSDVPKSISRKPKVPTDTTNVVILGGSRVLSANSFETALSSYHPAEAAAPAGRRSLLTTSNSRCTETISTPRSGPRNISLLQRLKAIDISQIAL